MNTKTIVMLAALCLVASQATQTYPSWVYDSFDQWCNKWEKTYDSPSEKEYRVGIYYTNLQHIQETNSRQDSYTLEANGFSSLTADEFVEMYTGANVPVNRPESSSIDTTTVNSSPPSSVDWVKSGYVTGVKNQGQCGSCWAFSSTGGLEGNYMYNKKKLISMSEQQLVDCSSKFGNSGCNGGWMDYAFKYTEEWGIMTESSYAYTARSGSCHYKGRNVVYHNYDYKDVQSSDKDAFVTILATRPISIAIDANDIMSYSSGIFNDSNCGTQLDHGVLAVGYTLGTSFTIKNSWGSTWGENGYIRFAMVDGDGMCGMYMAASYPRGIEDDDESL